MENQIQTAVTRRRAIGVMGMAWGWICIGYRKAHAESDEEISHLAEAIHQQRTFSASPTRVYDALTDTQQFDKVIEIGGSKKATAFGTRPTRISTEIGGSFTLFGGHIIGRHIELIPAQRIVQAWRVIDWEEGVYSLARFELKASGGGTKIAFDHTGFPKGLAAHLAEGWDSHYWEPLHLFLSDVSSRTRSSHSRGRS